MITLKYEQSKTIHHTYFCDASILISLSMDIIKVTRESFSMEPLLKLQREEQFTLRRLKEWDI